MRDTSTLRMPEHRPGVIEGEVCVGHRSPGQVRMHGNGQLQCTACGWATPEPVVTAYNPDTGHTFLTWEEMVEKESSGYVVVVTSSRPGSGVGVYGTFPPTEEGKRQAKNAQTRLRKKTRRDESPYGVRVCVRVLWPA